MVRIDSVGMVRVDQAAQAVEKLLEAAELSRADAVAAVLIVLADVAEELEPPARASFVRSVGRVLEAEVEARGATRQ